MCTCACTCIFWHPKELQIQTFTVLFAFFFHVPFLSYFKPVETAHWAISHAKTAWHWASGEKINECFLFFFHWVNTEMVRCVVWQAPGCCTVEQRARMCVGWREKQPAVKSAWLPGSFSHPKVCGRGGRKAFTTCWNKESLTGQMYAWWGVSHISQEGIQCGFN